MTAKELSGISLIRSVALTDLQALIITLRFLNDFIETTNSYCYYFYSKDFLTRTTKIFVTYLRVIRMITYKI